MVATINLRRPITDEEILRVSLDNPGWQVERESDGSLILSPTGASTSAKNAVLVAQLTAYAQRAGGVAFGPDAGFTMPDNALLSPDGAWIASERWALLTQEQRDSYPPIVPDVCIEIVSRSDHPVRVRHKVERYRRYGAQFATLIDPQTRESWSDGEPPPGFALDLVAIYDA